jgi:hypothetical protein
MSKIEQHSTPLLLSHPPWDFNFNLHRIPTNEIVSLGSHRPCTVRLYPCGFHSKESSGFSLVIADSKGVISIQNGSIAADSLYQAYSFALNKALSYSVSQTFFSAVEIYVTSLSRLSDISPAKKLSELDSANLSLLIPIQHFTKFYYGINNKSTGSYLASYWASRQTDPLPTAFLSPRFKIKYGIEQLLAKLWNDEWVRTVNGGVTRSFFPSVDSANSLLSLTVDRATAQIISGHCMLNAHQHRFGFADDPSCACGDPSENLAHFLISCPLFSSQRRLFQNASMRTTEKWPPHYSEIPQNPDLWKSLRQYLRSTGRLKHFPSRFSSRHS